MILYFVREKLLFYTFLLSQQLNTNEKDLEGDFGINDIVMYVRIELIHCKWETILYKPNIHGGIFGSFTWELQVVGLLSDVAKSGGSNQLISSVAVSVTVSLCLALSQCKYYFSVVSFRLSLWQHIPSGHAHSYSLGSKCSRDIHVNLSERTWVNPSWAVREWGRYIFWIGHLGWYVMAGDAELFDGCA